MLTPSELREWGKRTAEGSNGDFCQLLWELCEQVAMLTQTSAELVDFANNAIAEKNQKCNRENMAGIISMLEKPELMAAFKAPESNSPRILKASEITEPGWYFWMSGSGVQPINFRRMDDGKLGDWDWVRYAFDETLENWMQEHDSNFYGPIQLPE